MKNAIQWDCWEIPDCIVKKIKKESNYDMSNQDVSDDIFESDTLSVVDDTKLQIVIKNGVSGSKYKLSFRAYISDTKQLEEDVIFKVKD